MASTQAYRLVQEVLENSEASHWQEAKEEWTVSNYFEEDDQTCVCGKRHIRHCYRICNERNQKTLYPIGSECVKRFANDKMEREMKIWKQKTKIFKNVGGKHNGRTYGYICDHDPGYVEFLEKKARRAEYVDLVRFYRTRNRSKPAPPQRDSEQAARTAAILNDLYEAARMACPLPYRG